MNNALFSFTNLDIKKIIDTNSVLIVEADRNDSNYKRISENIHRSYYVLFIYVELNVDKNFHSNDNMTIAVLIPDDQLFHHMQEMSFAITDLVVTLKADDKSQFYLEQRADDSVEIDLALSKMTIDHFIICNNELNLSLNMTQLTNWLEEKYLIYEKKSVAVSFYTYKQTRNAYGEDYYEKSIKSYRYIFKSDVK
ncbi:hypothetical protein [Kurthia sibirica]|uniref:Uncharacterized protein n=2 Tax=Kurthia sibirica TaxID=202750 RepID=A0A2U3AJ04_9BACL|nr:hypothetical protein [Kurthia sibirica]PWI24529.1 hypothetical protein DEX24_13130 [Kurthia sibirica]GEK33598.1 hypothetical protein KSI01_11310 [Kurthia sibirica]